MPLVPPRQALPPSRKQERAVPESQGKPVKDKKKPANYRPRIAEKFGATDRKL
ncbi:uncharacterized protein TRIVIDRAFT_185494 [Trichoderma virens Gv29-8]|uniref:Uncharacterized protein n=1 Tax=Hypocrea virens (strain Gv29-8 / FGSC 10586) TaxID=413071 RepID=G9ME89_HYPVG|nr:uncharacterized protein TRIVIDRAFT_185494 [Trichoderma virens Gv29-8]EHK27383.1 hypothetical protein TRIVIDRAFT_185494 [Trichoderma virens Gv29-8]